MTDGRRCRRGREARGKLVALALATRCCDDLYREAAAPSVEVRAVEVEVDAQLHGVVEPARRIRYSVKLSANGPGADVGAPGVGQTRHSHRRHPCVASASY